MTSGSETGSCEGRQIEEPKTLKDALDFLAALGNNVPLVTQVGEMLSEKAGMYFKAELLSDGAYGIEKCLKEVLEAVSMTREAIVRRTYKSNYGNYGSLMNGMHCVETCINFFFNILPILHATIYYLYFRVDTAILMREGGSWSLFRCDNDKEALYRWLTAQKNSDTTASANNIKTKMLLGGYSSKSELSRKYGYEVGEELSNIVDSESSGGRLPDLLITVFFDTTLTHGSAAAVLSFIGAFCTAVNNGAFNGNAENRHCLKEVCSQLLSNIQPVTPNPTDPSAILESLFQGTENDYVKILSPAFYNKYVEWLKDKLPMLITYLDEMQKCCKNWYPSSPINAHVVGPFAYGFMFGRKWSTASDITNVMSNMPADISQLTGNGEPCTAGTLCALWQCIAPDQYTWPFTSASSESTAVAQDDPTAALSTAPAPEKAKNKTEPGAKQVPSASEEPTTQPPSASSTTSSIEPSVTSGASTQHNEQTTFASDTSGHSTGSQKGGHSGTTTSLHSCPPADACSEIHEGGSTGVVNTSSPESHHADDVTNAQSTITIGGATGGVAVLGGGCAALYFLNVGGIKTLITGVP
ncbi:secreted antigen 1 [Babesia caballi]|uniref:Secreted antigen 1 n=1 Tax=Babesia caballi TaxID=5871 RepID=A0AAV4LSQ6_BABCB|nr:secreted antigen 1 [Babesia caballi]